MSDDVKFMIGDFVVLPAHNKITQDSDEFLLEPKIMEVLCYFAKHPHQVISKQQILDGLWPGQTIGQEVITRAVFELRKIFKDDPKKPTFISTVTRKGYCLIQDVHEPEKSNPVEVIDGSWRKQKFAVLSVVMSMLVAAIFITFSYEPDSQSNSANKSITLISHDFT